MTSRSLTKYMEAASKYKMLSREEELEIGKLAFSGDLKARKKLVEANLRFVVSVANRFAGYKLDIVDLIQEGNIGLMKAAERFDPSRGCRFNTYAVWWIRAYIQLYVMRNWSNVKLGGTIAQRFLFFRLNATRNLLGVDSSAEELASCLGVRPRDVEMMASSLAAHDTSLDAPLSEDGRGSRLEALRSTILDQEESLHIKERRKLLTNVIERLRLSDRERQVLKGRFLEEETTLQELGDRLGISRERVRQLEAAILRKLRLATPSEEVFV